MHRPPTCMHPKSRQTRRAIPRNAQMPISGYPSRCACCSKQMHSRNSSHQSVAHELQIVLSNLARCRHTPHRTRRSSHARLQEELPVRGVDSDAALLNTEGHAMSDPKVRISNRVYEIIRQRQAWGHSAVHVVAQGARTRGRDTSP